MAKVRTIISLDESLLGEIEQIAAELNVSIDQLFEMAVREFFEQYESQKMIKKINQVYADEAVQDETRKMTKRMQSHVRRMLKGSW